MSLLPVPTNGWSAVPAWALCQSRNEFNQPDLPLLSMSASYGLRIRDLSEGRAPSEDLSGYRVVRQGDLVVNKLSARDGALGVSPHVGIVSPAYWVLRLSNERLHPAFMHHLLRSGLYRAEIARRSKFMPPAQFDLPWEQFRSLPLLLPPLEEQRRIADFLDDQVTLLDRAIQLRQQQKDLLAERRWSALLEMVMDEVNVPLRRIVTFMTDGPFGSAFTSSDYVDEGALAIRLGNIGFAEYKGASAAYIPEALWAQFPRCHVRAGDLLVASLGDPKNHAGRACVAPELGLALVKGKCFCVRVDDRLAAPDYVALILSSPLGADLLSVETRGATRGMINLEILRSVALPMPPRHRQQQIAEQTRREWTQADRVGALMDMHSDLLRERKHALITAAVTGQFDVATARKVEVA